ncbi:MAG: hypothetical protein LBT85_01560, partial [Bifidobacteriaceae bacterium]|nr:hypothetical protein [Bifidobacteriaceae bacterium]
CSGSTAENKQHRVLNSSTYKDAQASDFDGPYAQLFANLLVVHQSDESDFVYNIIKDSKITGQEFQEVQNNVVKCLSAFDVKIIFAGADLMGAYGIIVPDSLKGEASPKPDNVSRGYAQCMNKIPYIDIAKLYYRILWNPQNEDLSEYSAQCLVKLGFESQGFSGADFKAKYSISPEPPSGFIGPNDKVGAAQTPDSYGYNGMTYSDAINCTFNPKYVLNSRLN